MPGQQTILVLLILLGFVFLGSSRLQFGIRMVAIQGALIGLLPLFDHLGLRPIALAAINVGIKGVILPILLRSALRRLDLQKEVDPLVGFNLSLGVGVIGLGVAFWLASRLEVLGAHSAQAILPTAVAFFSIFVGLFIIICRRNALTQVLGYLVMENGVYIFGLALALETPMLVELGILLDVFVAVFVMGIMIFHISQTFDHIDTDQLSQLKE